MAQNETRAVFQIARLLTQAFPIGQDKPFSLICNIDPDQDPSLKTLGLPQLDALLIAPDFVAIIELKNYFDPIEGSSAKGAWNARTKKGRQRVLGGSKKNPYLQMKHMRSVWSSFLGDSLAAWPELNWRQLNGFLLFHPYLHPKSKITIPPEDDYYMQVGGVTDIARLVHTTASAQLNLNSAQAAALIGRLNVKPWKEIYTILSIPVGFIHVVEPDKPLVRHPIHQFDEWTIGRSTTQPHHIQLSHPKISGTHAKLTALEDGLFLDDLDSRNGIFDEKGARIQQRAKLEENQLFYLGAPTSENGVQIWLEPIDPNKHAAPTRQTI